MPRFPRPANFSLLFSPARDRTSSQGYLDDDLVLLRLLLVSHEPDVVFVPRRVVGTKDGGSRRANAILDALTERGAGADDDDNREDNRVEHDDDDDDRGPRRADEDEGRLRRTIVPLPAHAFDRIDACVAAIREACALPDDAAKLLLCWNIMPGQIAPMDEALIALQTCRDLKKAAYSTPFTNMNQFVQFFQKFPGVIGDGTALPINSRLVKEHLGVTTTMVRITSKGVYRKTEREHTTVIDLASGATVYSHIH